MQKTRSLWTYCKIYHPMVSSRERRILDFQERIELSMSWEEWLLKEGGGAIDVKGCVLGLNSNGKGEADDGLLTNDDNIFIKSYSSGKRDAEIVGSLSNTVAEKDSVLSEVDCILKCKSVFRCRLCPRIVCLSEETLKTHLKSKRHARSEKLLSEGRLKLMLNSDGEIEEEEEDGETHAERHARIVAATQNSANSKKKNKGRQRQRKRLKKKEKGKDKNLDKAKQLTKSPAKKRLKSEI